ncbi:MAG: hypothetical protein WCP22_05685 [Chlamydiota bacterium]
MHADKNVFHREGHEENGKKTLDADQRGLRIEPLEQLFFHHEGHEGNGKETLDADRRGCTRIQQWLKVDSSKKQRPEVSLS